MSASNVPDSGTVTRVMSSLAVGPIESIRANRVRVSVPTGKLKDALRRCQEELACDHLVQIAAVDTGKVLELHYHLTGPHRRIVTVRIELPRTNPKVASSFDLLPPAGIYERQIHDLFGISFEGHPDLRRIILNEHWPEGEFPLRKDWTMDPKKSYGGPKEVP